MADDLRTPRAPRARPVVDLPGEAMLAHAEELAKRWAIALILARPLEGLADLPLEELAREAPSLCAQALRAMQSDVELERLTGAGASSAREDSAAARRLAGIVGARDAAAAVTAVEALRGVLWETLLAQLSEPSARLVGDMSDRLAYVCAATLAAAVDAAFAPGAGALSHEGDLQDAQSAGGAGEQHARELEPLRPPGGEAVIVDERAHADEHGADAPRGEPASDSVPPQVPGRPREARPLSWDESPPVPPRVRALSWDQSPPVPPRVARASERPLSGGERPPSSRETPTDEPEIEIRDERREEGPAAWIGSIGARLERFERDRLPFVVLLVELIELEHVRREELSELAGLMEQALASALGAAGSLTRERPGRCWLLVSETDGPRAQQLAERLVDTAAMRTSRRGTPLRVAIGTAVCPEDGREAAMLAAHADVGLYAARSAVRSSSPRQPATPVDESA